MEIGTTAATCSSICQQVRGGRLPCVSSCGLVVSCGFDWTAHAAASLDTHQAEVMGEQLRLPSLPPAADELVEPPLGIQPLQHLEVLVAGLLPLLVRGNFCSPLFRNIMASPVDVFLRQSPADDDGRAPNVTRTFSRTSSLGSVGRTSSLGSFDGDKSIQRVPSFLQVGAKRAAFRASRTGLSRTLSLERTGSAASSPVAAASPVSNETGKNIETTDQRLASLLAV